MRVFAVHMIEERAVITQHHHPMTRPLRPSVRALPDFRLGASQDMATYLVTPPRTWASPPVYGPETFEIFDSIPDLVCIQAWITASDYPRGTALTPPLIGLLERGVPETRARCTADALARLSAPGGAPSDARIIAPSYLAEMSDRSGFSAVREPGYPDRVFLFRQGLAFAYEDAYEALIGDPALPQSRLIVPMRRETHARTCSMVAFRPADGDASRPAAVQRILDTLSAVLSAEQSEGMIHLRAV